MKYLIGLLVLIFLITSCQVKHIPTENTHIPPSYKMVWHDEFDGDKLNRSKREYNLGSRRDAINIKQAISLTGDESTKNHNK